MNCNKCGNQLEPGAKFCGKCGAAVENASSGSSSQQASPETVAPMQAPVAGQLDAFKVIFQSAWDNFTAKFWKLMLLQFLMFIPFIVIGIVVAIAMAAKLDFQNTSVLVVSIIVGFVALVAIIYWFIWTQAATIQMLLDSSARGIKETLMSVKPKLRNYFLASLLSGLIILGGFILLIIPALIFAVMYGFASYIAIAEDKGAVESVKRSRLYVKNRFWPVAGKLALFFLAYIGASILVGILDGLVGAEDAQIFTNIFSFVSTPLVTAYVLALYLNLKKVAGEVTVS